MNPTATFLYKLIFVRHFFSIKRQTIKIVMTTKSLPQDVKPLCQSAPLCPTSTCVVLSSKTPKQNSQKAKKETSVPTQGNGWQACLDAPLGHHTPTSTFFLLLFYLLALFLLFG